MKKYVLIIALIVGGLTACSDWLDVQPKTSIKGKDLFSSESGFKDASAWARRRFTPRR